MKVKTQPVELFGLTFPSRIGLAAGFDKNAYLVNQWEELGFGFIEIGTVTPLPQYGNPKPRIFRLPKDKALINRLGFNNLGMEVIANRLKGRTTKIPVGGNIGKNKTTLNELAAEDYIKCFQVLFPYVDFFTLNVSSPNTPDLRILQDKEPLKQLLKRVVEENTKLGGKPVLLKIAPDLTLTQVDDIIEIVRDCKISGLIICNTTISREGLLTDRNQLEKIGAGGLSGKPILGKSNDMIRYVKEKSNGTIPIIGVGGISTANDAIEKLRAGASLVQLYTGFIYEGPILIQKIKQEILNQNL